MSTNAIVETIRESGICLNPTWAAAYEIARMAAALPASVQGRGLVPSTVAPALMAAYRRASEVLEFNRRRQERRNVSP
jgi:hypothetical protein